MTITESDTAVGGGSSRGSGMTRPVCGVALVGLVFCCCEKHDSDRQQGTSVGESRLRLLPDTVDVDEKRPKLRIRGEFPDDTSVRQGGTLEIAFLPDGHTNPVPEVIWDVAPGEDDLIPRIVEEHPLEATALRTLEFHVDVPEGALGLYDIRLTCKDAAGRGVEDYTMDRFLSVIDIQFVTRGEKNQVVPLPEGFRNCIPRPVVTAKAGNASLSSSGVVTLNISGTVTDETSDVVWDAQEQVQELYVVVGNEVVETIRLSNALQSADLSTYPSTTYPDRPWKPYKFRADFSTTVTFEVGGAGPHPVVLETSANAAGNTNTGYVTVIIGDRGVKRYSAMLNLVIDPAEPGQVAFYLGDREPKDGDEVLTETATANEFRGMIELGASQGDVTALVQNFGGLTGEIDDMLVLFTLLSPDGRVTSVEAPMIETPDNDGRFTYDDVRIVSGDGRSLVGKYYISDTVNLVLAPDHMDKVTFGFRDNPELFDEIELAATPPGSKVFTGDDRYARVRAAIEQFAGLSAEIDTMDVLFEFTYPDDLKAVRRLTLTETLAESRRFKHREMRTERLTLDSVEGEEGRDPGTFLPVMVRVRGTEQFLDAHGKTFDVMQQAYEVAPFDSADGEYHYAVDPNGKPVVFVPAATAVGAGSVMFASPFVSTIPDHRFR
ncbi:MAG: hypothetical protein ACYSUI_20855 [Planctomycetota bacterium]